MKNAFFNANFQKSNNVAQKSECIVKDEELKGCKYDTCDPLYLLTK